MSEKLPKFLLNFLAKIGFPIIANATSYTKIFTIPPDMDDSSLNVALGIKLHELAY